MKNTGWGEKTFHMIHTFIFANRVVGENTSRGVIASKTGVISIDGSRCCTFKALIA